MTQKTAEQIIAPILKARGINSRGVPQPKKTGSGIPIIAFDDIRLGTERRDLVKGLIPRVGLCVIWGPKQCGKSFSTFDIAMYVALGWDYRGRRTQQGPVVYCAFEGQLGFNARVEAFRQKHLADRCEPVPFYLVPVTLNLVKQHVALIAAIKAKLGNVRPVAVVLDTLNRSLEGSESSDQDMTAYVRAADAIRETFKCAVIIVHHCGVKDTRPRGHTSLTGAADAQLAVSRDAAGTIEITVEYMKDGPTGDTIDSRLEVMQVGTDEDGELITSCVIIPAAPSATPDTGGPRLSRNQQTMFSILHDAGEHGLSTGEWNNRAREAGTGSKRKADLYDIRAALKSKGLIRQYGDRWNAC